MARIALADACKFEKSQHEEVSKVVENNSKLLDEVVQSVVDEYCSGLDAVINEAHAALVRSRDLTDREIDNFILKLPVEMYYSSTAQEFVGVREDVAKMIRQRMYIEARQSASGTVQDKDTAAEKAVMQETLSMMAYNRAKKTIQAKNEMALEVLSAFKKVTSRRMEEYQLSRFGGSSE